jgi:hypothetical protein
MMLWWGLQLAETEAKIVLTSSSVDEKDPPVMLPIKSRAARPQLSSASTPAAAVAAMVAPVMRILGHYQAWCQDNVVSS